MNNAEIIGILDLVRSRATDDGRGFDATLISAAMDAIQQAQPKKRGRKAKSTEADTMTTPLGQVLPPKRRGRPPKAQPVVDNGAMPFVDAGGYPTPTPTP